MTGRKVEDMKRIANNLAVQTLLYTVAKQQEIIIRDYENSLLQHSAYKEVYRGENYLIGPQYARINYSKIRKIEAIDNALVISICTRDEQY
jgi:hypothetical protein